MASKKQTKKAAPKQPTSAPKADPKPPVESLTDEQLVVGLKKVQRRKLTNAQFAAVSQTIKLLVKE